MNEIERLVYPDGQVVLSDMLEELSESDVHRGADREAVDAAWKKLMKHLAPIARENEKRVADLFEVYNQVMKNYLNNVVNTTDIPRMMIYDGEEVEIDANERVRMLADAYNRRFDDYSEEGEG